MIANDQESKCLAIVDFFKNHTLTKVIRFLLSWFFHLSLLVESEQIVAEDDPVVEEVVIGGTMRSVIRLRRIFEQDARVQPGPVLLPNPSQFQFLLFRHAHQGVAGG